MATLVVPLVQLPASPFDVKVTALPPIQAASLPLNVPAFGAAVTVTVLLAVALEHPPVPVTSYVINDDPAATGVIAPEAPSIVATPVVALVHAPPASPLEVNVVEPFEQIASVPLNVPAFGAAVITPETAIFWVEDKPPPVTVTFPLDGLDPADAILT